MKPLMLQYSTVASRSTAPFAWQAAGMGYVFRSSEGRFVVIDGGHGEDAEPLTQRLESMSEGQKPVVALWIITHPHVDHYGAAVAISKSEVLRARVDIQEFMFCMPDENTYYVNYKKALPQDVRAVISCVADCGAAQHTAKSGEELFVDDLKIEVLLTVDDLAEVADLNETSMIFRITAVGQSVLFLGDTSSRPSRQLAAKLGEALKSDFCQLAHHALNGGADELYALVKPRVALVPMTRPAYFEMLEGRYKDDHGTRHNRHCLKALPVAAHWLSADGDVLVEMPFDFAKLS